MQKNVSLKDYSYYRIGGNASYFFEFKNLDDLKRASSEWKTISSDNKSDICKLFTIGSGTNILFSDRGYDGLILYNSIDSVEEADNIIKIGSGTSIDSLNHFCIGKSYSGMEWSGGLPGTLGGAIFGNAGAFGGETKDVVVSVTSYDFLKDNVIVRNCDECQFSYRNSIFKKNREVIVSATLRLKTGLYEEIKRVTDANIQYRETNQPLEFPSLGSTFKNIDLKKASEELKELCKEAIKYDPFPVIPVAYLIHLAGLKGKRFGDIEISSKHPNFFINRGNASSKDVENAIEYVSKTLFEKYGVTPELEIFRLE